MYTHYYRMFLSLGSEIGIFAFQAAWGCTAFGFAQSEFSPNLLWKHDLHIDYANKDPTSMPPSMIETIKGKGPKVNVFNAPYKSFNSSIPFWALVIPTGLFADWAIGRPNE